MQPTKGRESPKESPQKVCSRSARELKISPVERGSLSPSTNTIARTPKDKSPKVAADHRSPRSPICEMKRPSKLSELESQISKLQNELKTVKDQLVASESSKTEAEAGAEEVKKQLADVSSKLDESEKQLTELEASKNAILVDQQDDDSVFRNSTLDEIHRLKEQLEKVSELKDAKEKESDATLTELQSLRNTLAENVLLVETMKFELERTKESEAQAKTLMEETLLQLEAAKETINALRLDIVSTKEASEATALELQHSRAHGSFLESFVDNLKKINTDNQNSGEVELNLNNHGTLAVDELQKEIQATKAEVRQLNLALEASERRFNEEQHSSQKQIKSAAEVTDQIKAQSIIRESELKEDLKKATVKIDELKASLMDKETELQCISEENESLTVKLEKSTEAELARVKEHVSEMKAHLMDKETELQNIFSENENLKVEISKRETGMTARAADLETARATEVAALEKLGLMTEEVDKSTKKVERVTEQLKAAQAANGEMEAELRRLKVQSDQWRKAAEAAASMLSPGSGGKYVERSGSMPLGSKYSPSPYVDDYYYDDDDSFKKKNGNGNVLKKFGVLWKKPQK